MANDTSKSNFPNLTWYISEHIIDHNMGDLGYKNILARYKTYLQVII